MEKIIHFRPAYDKRDPEPSKNRGIHGVDMLFVLKGNKGAVQFLLYTNWHLPHVAKELKAKHHRYPWWEPNPADLGYHSPKPMFEGHICMTESCEWLDGKPCFYDGSGLNADPIFRTLLEEGSDGVWKALEEYYNKLFDERSEE